MNHLKTFLNFKLSKSQKCQPLNRNGSRWMIMIMMDDYLCGGVSFKIRHLQSFAKICFDFGKQVNIFDNFPSYKPLSKSIFF